MTDAQNSKSTLPPKTELIAFFAMVVGMFMAVLDIQIVASSLSVIGAGLSASADELSWVQTSYMIAEVIMIPSTGFLSRLLSVRVLYFIATLGFTVMSIACATAWNIESMIVFRSLQGIFGGAMIPTAFSTSFMIFDPKDRGKVSIIIGLVVTMAPTLGPTIGGYVTEVMSWHFMFLLNIIPGIFVCTITWFYAYFAFDKANYALFKNFDYLGLTLMIVCLGSMQYILEEGVRLDWFDSSLIILLSLVVIVTAISLAIVELRAENPILGLHAFKNRNFLIGSVYSGVLGVGLFGAVYLLPLFLYRVTGMDTFQIGIIMMVTGGFQFISAPFAGRMYDAGVNRRVMLAMGLALFSCGCFLNGRLDQNSHFAELFLPQAVRGFALMFCFIPINDIALGTMPRSEVQNASGLYNLMRNLGGAIGLAVINTNLTTSTVRYTRYLHENITIADGDKLYGLQMALAHKIPDAKLVSYALLDQMVARDAFILAINNIFMFIATVVLISIPLILFAKDANSKADITSAH